MRRIKAMQLVYSLILFSVIIFQSCIEKVDYDQIKTPDPKLVVNSYITPDSLMEFFVHKTSGMIDTNYYIENGNIEIWEDNIMLTTLTENKKGHFLSSLKPKVNSEYKIIVNADDLHVSAQTSIPDSTEIASLSFIYPAGYAADTYFHGDYAKLFITIDDPQEENYYEIVVFGYNPDNGKYSKGYIRSNNFIIKAEGDMHTIQKLVFSDIMFNGQRIVLDVETLHTTTTYPYITDTKKTIVVLRTVSEEYYRYHKTLLEHYYNQGLIVLNSMEATARMQFTGTPVDVYTNIEGGYGVFAGYSTFIYEMDNYPEYP